MQSQPRTLTGRKTRQRLNRNARQVRHAPPVDTTMLELEELEDAPLENEPVFRHVGDYFHRQPGDMSEEDAENAQAEISELFRGADRL